ncbi:MAG: acyltransferase [Planctomycetaceae bacterium]
MRISALWRWPSREYSPTPSDHRTPLDGVRGLAILLVFLYDCLKLPADGMVAFAVRKLSGAGWMGVDLFFVLSGCLITGILLDTCRKPGFLRSFFARRALRIFPLYYLALWAAFIATPQLAELWGGLRPIAVRVETLTTEQVWFWTYLQNWRFAWSGAWPDISYLNHFWSLAVEEQFYLFWPFVVAACSRKGLARVCWGCVIVALGIRVALLMNGFPSVTPYVITIARMDSLCLGGLIALGLRSPDWYPRLVRWAWPAMVAAAAIVVAVDIVWPVLQSGSLGQQTIGHTLLGVMFGALIFSATAVRADHWFGRLLSMRWLTLPGQYSYALYVIHRPVHRITMKLDWSQWSEGTQAVAVFGTTLLVSLLLAALSWKFFEQPLLSLKRYFPRPDAPRESTALVADNRLPRLSETAHS